MNTTDNDFWEEIKSANDFGILVEIVHKLVEIINKDLPKKERLLNLIKPLIPKPIKGDKGDPVEKIVETIIEKQPIITNEIKEVAIVDTPEIIKEKLESLEDEEKLSIKAIKDLQEELDKLKKEIDRKAIIGGAGPTGGHMVKAYDISDQLNGVLKTFSLPVFWRVIGIVSSSFPTAFRLTTDYTVDGSLFKITFTSEIDAETTLASGQTIIVTYSE